MRAILTMLLALGAGAACSAAPANPLIGQWRIVNPDCQALSQLVYTPTEYAGFETAAGVYPGWRKIPVIYNVSATEVWVLPSGAFSNQTRVFIIDATHIKPDDGQGCIYQKVG